MKRTALAIPLIGLLLASMLAGCQKEEGPAERAGKQFDQAVQNAGKQMEKAGQDIQKSAEDARKK